MFFYQYGTSVVISTNYNNLDPWSANWEASMLTTQLKVWITSQATSGSPHGWGLQHQHAIPSLSPAPTVSSLNQILILAIYVSYSWNETTALIKLLTWPTRVVMCTQLLM